MAMAGVATVLISTMMLLVLLDKAFILMTEAAAAAKECQQSWCRTVSELLATKKISGIKGV